MSILNGIIVLLIINFLKYLSLEPPYSKLPYKLLVMLSCFKQQLKKNMTIQCDINEGRDIVLQNKVMHQYVVVTHQTFGEHGLSTIMLYPYISLHGHLVIFCRIPEKSTAYARSCLGRAWPEKVFLSPDLGLCKELFGQRLSPPLPTDKLRP